MEISCALAENIAKSSIQLHKILIILVLLRLNNLQICGFEFILKNLFERGFSEN